jgi:hypothetical protein
MYISTMEKCCTLFLQYLYSRCLESQDLALLSNTTSEELLDDLTLKHRLRNNALNMLRAHSAIPDTLASQRMAAERRRNVDNDIASPLVSTDVRDQTHSRSRSVSHHLGLDLRGLCYRSIFQQRHILPLQFLLELIAEHGTQLPTPFVPATVSADEDQDLVDFARARELSLDFRRAEEDVLLVACKAIMLLVEARGQNEASEEGFYGRRFGGNVRDVLEAGEEERRGGRSGGCVLRYDAGIFAWTAGGY